jgi:Tol biopolymer transport system component
MASRRFAVLSAWLCPALALAQGAPAPFPGNDHSYAVSGSNDLRLVAFASDASNLVRGDTNGRTDIFVHDRIAGTLRRASVDRNGIQANGSSARPHLSGNGRFVAFDTTATNLTGAAGLVVKDLQTGTLQQARSFTAGVLPFPQYARISDNGGAVAYDALGFIRLFDTATAQTIDVTTSTGGFDDGHPAISGDGAFVVFVTSRTSLVTGDTNGLLDVYRWSRASTGNPFVRVSVSDSEQQGNDHSGNAGGFVGRSSDLPLAINGNGNRIAFVSAATNLTNDSVGARGGIFLRDVTAGTTIKLAACTNCGLAFSALELDGAGTLLGFHAAASFFEAATGTTRAAGYYLVDVTTGAYTPLGSRGNVTATFDANASLTIDDNGSSSAFQTADAVAGVDERARFVDVVVRDPGSGPLALASRASIGTAADGHSRQPSLSDDGRRVVFSSWASNLASGDANLSRDVFLHDLASGSTTLMSAAATGTPGDGDSAFPSISGDGTTVAFFSRASNLGASGGTGTGIYVRTLASGALQRIVPASGSAAGPNALSRDGRYLALRSFDRVFVADLQLGSQVAMPTSNGLAPDAGFSTSYPLSISDDGRFVAFGSGAGNLVAGQVSDSQNNDVFVFDRVANSVELINRATGAAGVEGNFQSLAPTISGDGRYVAFYSEATNLAAITTPGYYLRDRTLATTTRIGSLPRLTNFIGAEPGPFISRDGAFVAFVSGATDLVAGDSNLLPDLFLWRRTTGQITRASLTSAWTQPNGSSYVYDNDSSGIPRFYGVALSRNAGVAAFGAAASNLAQGDGNAADDVFVLQRNSQAIARASAPPVIPADDDRSAPSVSRTGRIAASVRTNRRGALGGLATGKHGKGGSDKWSDIALYDFSSNQEQQVDVSSTELPADGDSFFPSVSGSGTQVTFASDATNLGAAPDVDTQTDIFVRDTSAGITVPITANADAGSGQTATAEVGNKWSAVFESDATNLPGAASANGAQDIFVAAEGPVENTFAIEPISVPAGGGTANGPSSDPAVSDNARFVAYSSLATNLVAGDNNGVSDIFLRDTTADTTARISLGDAGVEPNGASGNASIVNLGASSWVVAFESEASNLDASFIDGNNDTDVYVRVSAGTTELISRGMGGLPANGKSSNPSLTPDGRFVTFVSTADNLVPNDNNNTPDVFVFDRVLQSTTRISIGSQGQEANDFALQPGSGQSAPGAPPTVVFDSPASNILPFDEDQAFDLFMVDASNGAIDTTGEVIFRWSYED